MTTSVAGRESYRHSKHVVDQVLDSRGKPVRGDGRVDAPAAAPAETAGTMRSFSDWLEDKLW
jgi:hypothetical protein